MNVAGLVLTGFGIIFLVLGIYLLVAHYKRPSNIKDYVWLGQGQHPFKKS